MGECFGFVRECVKVYNVGRIGRKKVFFWGKRKERVDGRWGLGCVD